MHRTCPLSGVKRRSLFSPEFLAFWPNKLRFNLQGGGEKTGFGGRETNGHWPVLHGARLYDDF